MDNLYESKVWRELCSPFAFKDLEIKPQSVSKKGDKALPVMYFDARAVITRLNEVLGPNGWRVTNEPTLVTVGGKSVTAFIATLTMCIEGQEVVRQGCADATDIEPSKGAESGALKRAFSAVGSLWLYEVDLPWLAIETYDSGNGPRFSGWTKESLAEIEKRYDAAIARAEIETAKRWLRRKGLFGKAMELLKGSSPAVEALRDMYYEVASTEQAVLEIAKRYERGR